MKSAASAVAFVSIALAIAGCNETATTEATKAEATETVAPAAGTVTDADKTAAETVIRTIYDSYKTQERTPGAEERPVYSAELTRLIAGLPRPDGMVGPLQDADWFCQCQDWNEAEARVTELTSTIGQDGKISVTSHFMPTQSGDPVIMTYTMVKEDGQWKIDDMTSSNGTFSLRRDIAAGMNEATGE